MEKNRNLDQLINGKKRSIVIKFAVLVAIILVVVFAIFYTKNLKENPVSLHDEIVTQLENSETKGNAYASVDVYGLIEIGKYEGETGSYFMVFDENYSYIVYLSDETYDSIEEQFNDGGEYLTLEGFTSTFTSTQKTNILETVNEIYDYYSIDNLTSSEFDNEFGTIYLDTIKSNPSNILVVYPVAALIGFVVIAVLIGDILNQSRIKKRLNTMSESEKENIQIELKNEDEIEEFNKIKVVLTKSYIVNYKNLFILKYDDIFWIEQVYNSYRGVTTGITVFLHTNDGKSKGILFNGADKKTLATIEELIESITSKNPDIIINDNKRGRAKEKEIKKELKEEKKS